ncbi:dTDP-4-dehydrorhamnose 3,5-epimerase family protein [Actinomadura sp. NPDC047616]|uniref:dTDP-4-dehydrorhamnose 3,5-epimerase family protein n=1 Tax=Actinomadura sp. NPDC047616 TaxID=3155914 RepID=UPI003405AC06
MKRSRELAVAGAVELIRPVFRDHRGSTVAPFQQSAFREATGRPPFRVAQTFLSVSARGVVRGVHYTATPPGGAKFVTCVRGGALDIVVDLRVGSPTFGRHAAVRLDADEGRAVYLPVGVGHVFVALEDDTVMSYLLSTEYAAADELAVAPLDPRLGLPIPPDVSPVVSARDAAAPTFAEAAEAGLLPDYGRCLEAEALANAEAAHSQERQGEPSGR